MKASDINPEVLKRHGIQVPRNKPSKYGAKKTEYKGVMYDSQLEANVAAQLDMLQKAGKVTRWERQVRFDLAGNNAYVADFVVHYRDGLPRVLDPKGKELPVFRIKRKLFRERYGYDIDVVRHYKDTPAVGR